MQKKIITGACVFLKTMLLLSAAALEPIVTGLETDDMQVGDSEKWLWDKMWESKMLTDEQLSHVYQHGRLPGGSVVKDSPLVADRQKAWGKLAENNVVTGEELAQMLMGGSISNMSPREVRALEELAPVYEPDASKRIAYDVRRKHIAVDMIRRAKRERNETTRRQERRDAEAKRQGIAVDYADPRGGVAVITDFDSEGRPELLIAHNTVVAQHIKTDDVQTTPFWLGGHGIQAGLWDVAECRENHQEFWSNRVDQIDDTAMSHPHATAVAATMAARGQVSSAKGMAPQLSLKVWDADVASFSQMVADHPSIQVSAHPYGRHAGWYKWPDTGDIWWVGSDTNASIVPRFGAYSYYPWKWDQSLYDAPYNLAVFSSGDENKEEYQYQTHYCYYHKTWTNDWALHPRDGDLTDGYDTLNEYACAKNPLVVGRAYVSGSTNNTFIYSTQYQSSRGPADDGRIKPDVMAVASTVYSASDSATSAYDYYEGSSFCAGGVAGSLALIQQKHELFYGTNSPMLGSTYKALTIAAATDLETPGPDYKSGWGLVDVLDMAWAVSNNVAWFDSLPHIREVRLYETGTNSTATVWAKGLGTNSTMTFTIAWTDPEGNQPPVYPAHNVTNSVLVNDIDLRVYGPYSQGMMATNYPWVLDPQNPTNAATTGDNTLDNVEQVAVEAPGNLWYKGVISHKGSLSNGYQDVSVVIMSNAEEDGPDFEITDAGPIGSNGVVQLTWPGLAGGVYKVEGTTNDLASSNLTWNLEETVSANHDDDFVWTNGTPVVSNAFYRLKRVK